MDVFTDQQFIEKEKKARICIQKKLDEFLEYWKLEREMNEKCKEVIDKIIYSIESLKKVKSCSRVEEEAIKKINSFNQAMPRAYGEKTVGVFWGQIYEIRKIVANSRKSIQQIVSDAYKEITVIGNYSSDECISEEDDKFINFPDKSYKHVKNGGKGDSFIFSCYLLKVLRENGVDARLLSSNNGTENKYVVLYRDDDESEKSGYYIIDPCTLIRYYEEKGIPVGKRRMNKFIEGSTGAVKLDDKRVVDFSRIDAYEYIRESQTVKALGSYMDNENITVNEVIKSGRAIKYKDVDESDKSNILDITIG